jgi:inhibitor of the pro-sigma K processing machinery
VQNLHIYIWIGLALIAVFVLTQIIHYPKLIAWKIVKTAVVGLLFVFAVNWVGSYFQFYLPLNPLTALTAGILGLPGVAALVALQLWLFH